MQLPYLHGKNTERKDILSHIEYTVPYMSSCRGRFVGLFHYKPSCKLYVKDNRTNSTSSFNINDLHAQSSYTLVISAGSDGKYDLLPFRTTDALLPPLMHYCPPAEN